MSALPDFGELRSACQRRPSTGAFGSVLRLCIRAFDADPSIARRRYLPYAASITSRWPSSACAIGHTIDLTRCLTSPAASLLRSFHASNFDELELLTIADLEEDATLHNIEELTIGFSATHQQIDHITSSSVWERVHVLGITTQESSWAHERLRHLLHREQAQRIERLTLRGLWFNGFHVEAFTTSPWLNQVEALEFEGCEFSASAEITMSQPHTLSALRTLKLDRTSLRGQMKSFLEASFLPDLDALSLHDIRLEEEDLEHLSGTQSLPKLRHLSLKKLRCSDENVEGLMERARLPDLRVLRLEDNALGNWSAQALASATRSPELRELHLDNNRISAFGARALANTEALANLRTLSLRGNPLGADGIAGFLQGALCTRLHELNLWNTGMNASLCTGLVGREDIHPNIRQFWRDFMRKEDSDGP